MYRGGCNEYSACKAWIAYDVPGNLRPPAFASSFLQSQFSNEKQTSTPGQDRTGDLQRVRLTS